MHELALLMQAGIVGLASWRISSLFVDEQGPWHLFRKIRNRFGIIETDDIRMTPDTNMAQLLSCIWCFSVWITPIVWIIYIPFPELVFVIAAMSIAVIAERVMK